MRHKDKGMPDRRRVLHFYSKTGKKMPTKEEPPFFH